MLQNKMSTHLQHWAGLNPRSFRLCHMEDKLLTNLGKNVVDGELLKSFVSLPLVLQRELSKTIGSSVEKLLEDLVEIVDARAAV